ncbi:NADH-quinone oxidoreductase subunit C, partial [Streptomyces mangrovisoli]|uniref:NADH-quinone oxidoreductase subunit C n=1 Tax=Streptomyces mangrovisoli TaxID=1428628 RepID=UPI0009A11DF5
MTAVGWLPAPAEELFGPDATAEESYDVLTVDVPPAAWIAALETARDRLGCTYFDWLSAVDEPGTGFRVAAHVVALSPVRRLLVRTTVPHAAATLPSAVGVYAGAGWHERETHEMFGVAFEGHPALDHLLLPEGFEGNPLRKDFVLAARVAKAWPGAKEPGESDHGGPKRRQMLPPGVPDPNEWGPQKGRLPAAPARPARGAARPAGDRPVRTPGERPARPAGDRPVRRSRTAAEGSASQATPTDQTTPEPTRTPEPTEATQAAPGTAAVEQPTAGRPATEHPTADSSATAGPSPDSPSADASRSGASPTGASSAAEGTAAPEPAEGPSTSVAGAAAPAAPAGEASGDGTAPAPGTTSPRRSRSASGGSASQRSTPAPAPGTPRRSRSASEGSASLRAGAPGQDTPPARPAPRSSDAPWH